MGKPRDGPVRLTRAASSSGQAQSLVVYDWDAEGRLDLLATVIFGGQSSLVLYPQTTAGAFGAGQLLLAGGGASGDDLWLNLCLPSELTVSCLGLRLQEETKFPDGPRTRLLLRPKDN